MRFIQKAVDAFRPLADPSHRSIPVGLRPARRQWTFDLAPLTGESALSGICPVCGKRAKFDEFTDNPRESGRCSNCQSFNRQRQMAHAIRKQCGLPKAGPLRFPEGFVIYNTETTAALHLQLLQTPGYLCSEYFGDEYEPGQMVDGRRHEDLRHLSFEDNSIDLVLSSDVMEHMPDPYAAHLEILRVLKRGGRHIFTVPFGPSMQEDQIRAKLVDGDIVYLEEKAFHGDPVRPNEGVLVWTIFGLAMFGRLRELGFDVKGWNIFAPNEGVVGPWSLVFDARKPIDQ
jgi:SAM-dependent methyltransferase